MRNKVLIVEDMEINREILAEILKNEYPLMMAEGGRQAIELLREHEHEIAVVLLDLVMPDIDGFSVLEKMREEDWLDKIPVLVISGEDSLSVERKCFDMGISDFIKKPFDNFLVNKRVTNTVELALYKNHLEDKIAEQTQTLRKQYKQLQAQAAKLKKNNEDIIDILGNVVEGRSLESGEHIKRVKEFTRLLAQRAMEEYPEYGLTQDQVDMIASASSLHDIGKIAIPDSVLLKPGRLTPEEFDCMKTHTTKGSEILSNIEGIWDENYSRLSYEICRHHHEKYDGRGYPDGLSGEDIPLSAQIVSIADVYDALVSKRVYKDAYKLDEAYQMIMNGECGAFSPKLLDCFTKAKGDFENLVRVQLETGKRDEQV